MQAEKFKEISAVVSVPRLESYRRNGYDNRATIANYLWNVALAESLYPVLHILEIGFRNASDNAMTMRYGKTWLDAGPKLPFSETQVAQYSKATRDLSERGKPLDKPRILAELPFGFWTSLLGRRFERTWHGIIKNVFPYAPSSSRTRSVLSQRFDEIRRFRNRVFHHERIVDLPLRDLHGEIVETIGWISRELAIVANVADRFASVYADGFEASSQRLLSRYPVDQNAGVAPAAEMTDYR